MNSYKPWSYWFSDGTHGCIYAENKASAINSILELNPDFNVHDLTLHLEPEWTSNKH